jgi:DivIVA domain-containing protein
MIGPEDLHALRFERELRGYSAEEVDGYLDQLVFAWRTGGPPDALLASPPDPPFSIAVRGYKRADVDRVIAQIRSNWRRSPRASWPVENTAQPPATESSTDRIVDTLEERAMSVSEPSDVHEHTQPPAPSSDRFELHSIDQHDEGAEPSQPFPSGMPTVIDTPTADAGEDIDGRRLNDGGPAEPELGTLRPGGEPVAATFDRDHDVRAALYPPIFHTSGGSEGMADRSSTVLTEASAEPSDHEDPSPSARQQGAQAVHELRSVDEMRLHLLGVLDEAANDLRHPTRHETDPIAPGVDQTDDATHPEHQLDIPCSEPHEPKKSKKKKKRNKKHRPAE